jgi:hypothetical protein
VAGKDLGVIESVGQIIDVDLTGDASGNVERGYPSQDFMVMISSEQRAWNDSDLAMEPRLLALFCL